MKRIRVSVEYNFEVEIDATSEDFDKEFSKFSKVLYKDIDKFVFSNSDNPTTTKKIFFELTE